MTISPPLALRNLSWIRVFAVLLSALAAVALVVSIAYGGLGHWPALIALAAVAMIAERQGLEISPGLYVSVSFLPMALAAVIYGPGESALIGAVTMLLDYQGWPLERSAIYTAGRTLTGAAAGFAALAVTQGSTSSSLQRLLVASVAAALADMCVNMAVTGITLSLRGRLGLRGLWRMVRGSVVVSMALYAPITALFAYAYNGAGEWVLIFFLIPVLAAHLSLDMHARQARLISELEETNDQLVRTQHPPAAGEPELRRGDGQRAGRPGRLDGRPLGARGALLARHRRGAGAWRTRTSPACTCAPGARHRQDRRAGGGAGEDVGAERRRVGGNARALGDRRRRSWPGGRLRRRRRGRSQPPRALGRRRLPGRPGGRPDPADVRGSSRSPTPTTR